jgi:hypothetical protein
MNEIIKKILAVILALSKIVAGGYVLYYLIMNINNPTEFELSKIQWFFYFFIWDIWVHIHSDKLVVEENEVDK